MKTLDPSKKFKVTLIFLLDEEVTPQLFAQKVALACSRGTMREGDAVMAEDADVAIVIGPKTPFVPWLTKPAARKKAKRRHT